MRFRSENPEKWWERETFQIPNLVLQATKKPLEVTWSHLATSSSFFNNLGGVVQVTCPGCRGCMKIFARFDNFTLYPLMTSDWPGSNAISYTSVAWSRDELLLVGWVGWWQRFPWAQEMKHQIFVFFPKNLTNISPWVTGCLEDDSWFTSFVERARMSRWHSFILRGKTRDCCGRVRDLRLGRHFRQIPKTASPWWFIFFLEGMDYTGTQLCGDDFVHKPLKIKIPQIPICSMYVFFKP